MMNTKIILWERDDVLRLVSHVEGGVIGKVQREIDLKK